MDRYSAPTFVVWDITFACPLRCCHCYSESGRRPSRQLPAEGLYRVTDAVISLEPPVVVFSGGEPLLVKEIFEVADRMSRAAIKLFLYTSGWALEPAMISPIMALFSRVTVSVDGATALVHDRIRGRAGSYDRAMRALKELDAAVGEYRRRGAPTPSLAIDFVVMQSNFHQLREMCAAVVRQFPELEYVFFGAVVPTGLATRAEFAEQEMLSEEQADLLASGQLAAELQSLAPASIEVRTSDNRGPLVHPSHFAEMQIEPDGMVRAMPIFEGTVGSLLTEPPLAVWKRAVARWSDPFVVETLAPARTMKAWADAVRRIDQHFGSMEDRARIARRPVYFRG
jgi:molybdenum cofactor biosynthesis enzyme MoaA